MLYLCGVNAAKPIKQEALNKRCSPFAISVNIKLIIREIYNYGNSNQSYPDTLRRDG